MSKPKGGLQKKVSSIFDGVPMESEAARSGGHHAADTAGNIPAGEAKAAAPSPVVPSAPVASTPAVKPPVTGAPPAWPKAPAVQPEQEKPRIEPKPKSALAAALNADPDIPKITPMKLEPPRPPSPSRAAAEKPAAAPAPKVMGKVVVKHSAAENNKKTAILIGGLAVLLVIAILWSSGYLSGGSSTPQKTSSSAQQATLVPVKIDWQRPSAPPLSRNPMRPGGGNFLPGTNQRPGQDGTNSSFTVKGTFWSQQDGFAAMMGDGVTVRKGDTYHGAKILSITKNYVEYEMGGVTKREYVDIKDNQTGSTDVIPDANSQNIK